MQTHPDPAELLTAMRSGDTRALDSLYRTWSAKVRLFARLQLAPSGLDADTLADEITVDVFHDIWRHPERFDGRVAFNTWLFTLARNKAIDRLRQLQRRHAHAARRATDKNDLARKQIGGKNPPHSGEAGALALCGFITSVSS